jgi:hypothetical protein
VYDDSLFAMVPRGSFERQITSDGIVHEGVENGTVILAEM